jgi:hypothetical protein
VADPPEDWYMISGVLVMGWSKREFWVKGRSLSGSFRGSGSNFQGGWLYGPPYKR